ncbi:MAG TPA: class I SAM-dependent methyltransferase [Phycisphaerales bacterium]|nr:class I SAM-dependent methyltransferase [Phycisphaerales bacterium]
MAPHPVIANAYEGPENKRHFVDSIFNATAGDYDRVERFLSFGTGRKYRVRALARAGLKSGMRVIDVGVGTGLVASGAKSIVGDASLVIGVDPSSEMRRHAHAQLGIQVCSGTAESIPFEDASFDFLSMGYALRHITDLNAAFREFYRVLRPSENHRGGHLCILEMTRPRTRIGRFLLRSHFGLCLQAIRVSHSVEPRTPELWRYYWETIDACISPAQVMQALSIAGFVDVKRHIVGGIFSEYTARRR